MQHFCEFTSDQLKDNQHRGIFDALMYILILTTFLSCIKFYENTELLKLKVWDFRNVKANNYTIQLKVSKQMWINFSKSVVKDIQFNNSSDCLRNRYKIKNATYDSYKFLINKIFEDLLEEQILENLKEYNTDNKDIGIAIIQLAYENQTIIKLLIERGEIISRGGKT